VIVTKIRIFLLILLAILLFAGPVLAQISLRFDLGWAALSGGGGSRSSQQVQVDDALGQWPDGRSSSEQYRIDPGFWAVGRVREDRNTYLPLALRGE
jgi:hypothetical protein